MSSRLGFEFVSHDGEPTKQRVVGDYSGRQWVLLRNTTYTNDNSFSPPTFGLEWRAAKDWNGARPAVSSRCLAHRPSPGLGMICSSMRWLGGAALSLLGLRYLHRHAG